MVLHYGSDFTVDGAYFNKVFTWLYRPSMGYPHRATRAMPA